MQMTIDPVMAGGMHIGDTWPLAEGAALCHTFGFLHHRASRRYHLVWGESTRTGPSRILYTSSAALASGWEPPRTLATSDDPVTGLQLASSGGTETPYLFLTWQPLVGPGMRRPMLLISSQDGGRNWDGPHPVRQDEPLPVGGQVPPMDPSGGPGTEHLLATWVGSPAADGPGSTWALVATDRFIEWTVGLRSWDGSAWGETLYLGLRHHVPLPAALAEDGDGTLCLITLRTPTDFAGGAPVPEFPQVHAVRLDLPAVRTDSNGDGQPDVEDYLQVHYHVEDLYRLWVQCRVDGREMARRPFVSGVHKALGLRRGLVLESYRPFVRPGSGVPRTLQLMGRGGSRQVSIQDIANNRGNRYYQDRGKDRYPDTQGFHLAPGDVKAEDVKPGMVLVAPGWGHPTHRFTADLQVPSTTADLPARALFGFWSYNFPGAVLRTMPPDADAADTVSCRVVVELDEEVVLEDGIQFPVLVSEEVAWPDRSPLVVGYDIAPGSGFRLVAMGKVTGIPSSTRHVTHGTVL